MFYAVIMAVIVLIIMMIRWRAGDSINDKRAASWLKPWTAARKGLLGFKGIPLGDWGWFFLPVRFHGDGHILTVAAPGGGKSTTGSIPSCLDRSIKCRVVLDADRELTEVCYQEWVRTCGQENVVIIDSEKEFHKAPWNLPIRGFNPLKHLDPSKSNFQKECKRLAAAHITFEGMEDSNTKYFKTEALNKLAVYIAFGVIKGANLKQIQQWINLPLSKKAKTNRTVVGGYENHFKLWKAMKEEEAIGGWIADHANDFADMYINASEQFQAALSTLKEGMTYLDDPNIAELLGRDDFDFSMIKSGRATIALALPRQDLDQVYASFVRLFLSQVFAALETGPVAHSRVHILLEEFASLGTMYAFGKTLAGIRKKKAQIEVVLQSINQIQDNYKDWRSIMTMFEVRRYKAIRDPRTSKFLSDELGFKTVIEKDLNDPRRKVATQQLILTPQQIRQMPKDRWIAIKGNDPPAIYGSYAHWDKPHLKKRAQPSSNYTGGYPPAIRFKILRIVGGQALRIIAYLLGPHPVVSVFILSALIYSAEPHMIVEQQRNKIGVRCKYQGLFDQSHYYIPRWRRYEKCKEIYLRGWGLIYSPPLDLKQPNRR